MFDLNVSAKKTMGYVYNAMRWEEIINILNKTGAVSTKAEEAVEEIGKIFSLTKKDTKAKTAIKQLFAISYAARAVPIDVIMKADKTVREAKNASLRGASQAANRIIKLAEVK